MMQSMISFFMLDVYCSFKFFDARWELSVGGRCCGYHSKDVREKTYEQLQKGMFTEFIRSRTVQI
jgi:hypothetical protein